MPLQSQPLWRTTASLSQHQPPALCPEGARRRGTREETRSIRWVSLSPYSRHKTSPIWRHHNGSILKLKKHGKRQIYFLCDLKTKPHQLLNTMQWSLEAPSWSTSIYNNEDFIKQLFTLNLRTRHGEHPSAVFYLTKLKLREV